MGLKCRSTCSPLLPLPPPPLPHLPRSLSIHHLDSCSSARPIPHSYAALTSRPCAFLLRLASRELLAKYADARARLKCIEEGHAPLYKHAAFLRNCSDPISGGTSEKARGPPQFSPDSCGDIFTRPRIKSAFEEDDDTDIIFNLTLKAPDKKWLPAKAKILQSIATITRTAEFKEHAVDLARLSYTSTSSVYLRHKDTDCELCQCNNVDGTFVLRSVPTFFLSL